MGDTYKLNRNKTKIYFFHFQALKLFYIFSENACTIYKLPVDYLFVNIDFLNLNLRAQPCKLNILNNTL